MKVIQINTVYGSGSTGRTSRELHEALLKSGIDSFVIFGNGKRIDDERVFRSQTKFGYFINNFLSRLFGLEGFLAHLSTRKITKYIKKIKPDIVHLRNLHGHYVNLPSLFKCLKNSNCKIVISLHDLWLLTGSCPSPYLYNCERWKEKCHDCPAKHDYPSSWIFDFSGIMHSRKKQCLELIKDKLTVVGVSKWTKRMADLSGLSLSTVYIYNWIDTDKFCPKTREIHSSQIELVCVSSIWEKDSEKFKNLLYIADALPPEYHITMVGYCNFSDKELLPKNISRVPPCNTDDLALIYSHSDLFLHLSHSDTFGKVIAESLACGTPIIAFDTTAMSEMIESGCGSKIKPFDLDAFVNAIKTFKKKDKATVLKCRRSCLERFSFANIDKTIELYRGILNEN